MRLWSSNQRFRCILQTQRCNWEKNIVLSVRKYYILLPEYSATNLLREGKLQLCPYDNLSSVTYCHRWASQKNFRRAERLLRWSFRRDITIASRLGNQRPWRFTDRIQRWLKQKRLPVPLFAASSITSGDGVQLTNWIFLVKDIFVWIRVRLSKVAACLDPRIGNHYSTTR